MKLAACVKSISLYSLNQSDMSVQGCPLLCDIASGIVQRLQHSNRTEPAQEVRE
jgi:hypothetical protein